MPWGWEGSHWRRCVIGHANTSPALTNLFDSSPVLRQSTQLRRDSNISRGSASMMPVNSYLWTKVRSIAGQHTGGTCGLFVALKLKGRPFLCEVIGKWSNIFNIEVFLILIKLLCVACNINERWCATLRDHWRVALHRYIHKFCQWFTGSNEPLPSCQLCYHYGQLSYSQTPRHHWDDWIKVSCCLRNHKILLMLC